MRQSDQGNQGAAKPDHERRVADVEDTLVERLACLQRMRVLRDEDGPERDQQGIGGREEQDHSDVHRRRQAHDEGAAHHQLGPLPHIGQHQEDQDVLQRNHGVVPRRSGGDERHNRAYDQGQAG